MMITVKGLTLNSSTIISSEKLSKSDKNKKVQMTELTVQYKEEED